MHPIAQRLAIHAADARRLFAVHSVVNRSQGQEATRLVGVLRRSRQTAQPVRLKILPKTNSGAHSQPPESKCSGTNESHRSTRKQESYSLKAGITRSHLGLPAGISITVRCLTINQIAYFDRAGW